jgi:hypothetical protein
MGVALIYIDIKDYWSRISDLEISNFIDLGLAPYMGEEGDLEFACFYERVNYSIKMWAI